MSSTRPEKARKISVFWSFSRLNFKSGPGPGLKFKFFSGSKISGPGRTGPVLRALSSTTFKAGMALKTVVQEEKTV